MVKALLISLATVVGSISASASSLTDTYIQETKEVLSQLNALGFKDIACVQTSQARVCESPQSLAKKLDAIQFIELEKFHKPEGATRWGAFYQNSAFKIYLNRSANHHPQFIGFIGLHELLGALGLRENNFEISLAAYRVIDLAKSGKQAQTPAWLNDDLKMKLENFLDFSFANKEPAENNILALSGGESSGGGGIFVGGGGGDTSTFEVRVAILDALYRRFPAEGLVDALFTDLPIEISQSDSDAIEYRIDGGFLLRQILIPGKLLERNARAKKNLQDAVNDIAWFMYSLRPDLANIPHRQVPGGTEPLSLEGLHPASLRQVWCVRNAFQRPPHSACPGQ